MSTLLTKTGATSGSGWRLTSSIGAQCVSARFNATAYVGSGANGIYAIYAEENASLTQQRILYWNATSGTGPLWCEQNDGSSSVAAGTTENISWDTGWHHVLGVFSPDNTIVCVDLGDFVEAEEGRTPSMSATKIGYLGTLISPFGFWNGGLAHIAAWNTDITTIDDAWKALAKGRSPLQVHPESLIMFTPFMGGNIDIIGNRTWLNVNSPADDPDHPSIARIRRFA